MKRVLYLYLLLLSGLFHAQNSLIDLEQVFPEKFEGYMTKNAKEQQVFKSEYKYLDSVNIYGYNYSSFDNLKIRGFLIEPKAKGKYPVIIFNRGGNREIGAVSIAMLTDFLSKIAAKGFIIIGSQLRGSGRSEGKDEFGGKDIGDVLKLFEIIDNQNNADKDRIGMLGVSRGTMTNFLVLKETNKVKANITIGGIADLNQKDRPEMYELYKELIPDFEKNPSKELDKRSSLLAISSIKNKELKNFIIHGANDERVNLDNAFLLFNKLTSNKFSTRLLIYEDANHGINNNTNDLIHQIIGFCKKTL
ncbi:S9 family peptidase [Epilithonimonas vandammei]|uniref:S9 family peptidase n=1 Tax=Epilithonimonas vandammei TaxID=2487072 RepID=A0A3G8ZCT5_9FLAO|nr:MULTISPECIES: prolyl oligopeptidase family serine peptidase [Epilithonimonas]AZI55199.1 S9 family peptidase [Epilithonimonas vandammei]